MVAILLASMAFVIAAIEAAARKIGPTVDDKGEALLFIVFRGRAEQYACDLSAYAQQVFQVVCDLPV
jgi:hypothetical protein